MVSELFAWLAVSSASASAGIVWAHWRACRALEASLAAKVIAFDEITAKASLANQSFAEKILQFDDRLGSLEFTRQAHRKS